MTAFKKTQSRAYSTRKLSSDVLYWKKLDFPVTFKEFTAIDYVDICPTEPNHIAVTSGPKVAVFHRETLQVIRQISQFKRLAFGARFRSDGQLLLAGSEEGKVKLFRQNHLLRVFNGHESATHRVDFVRGLPQIITFSDDKTAVVWDLTDESKICTLTGHTDFIRAGLASPTSAHLVLTGSYDHTVRLWDTRTAATVMKFNHEAPVESLLCFPTGSVVISAGGTDLKVWDATTGRLLSKVSQHHKTITCLTLSSEGQRLLSGSLDRKVKVYDINTYHVVHTLDYPAPVLSLAVAPGDSTIAVGMISAGSGLLSFQHRHNQEAVSQGNSKKKQREADIRNIISEKSALGPAELLLPEDFNKMVMYDRMLRRFQYSKALDVVMRNYFTSKKTHVSVSVLQELIRCGGIRNALAGRDAYKLTPVLKFVTKFIRYPNYKQVLMDVANILIDLYGDSLDENPDLINGFRLLQNEIAAEIAAIRQDVSLVGALQMFLTASQPVPTLVNTSVSHLTATSTHCQADVKEALTPSASAQSAAAAAAVVDVS